MSAQTLNMDGDDASDLIVEVERSFAIMLGHDLAHVVTVGDLHEAIVHEIGDASGNVCPTSRTFYRLRTALGCLDARPDATLKSIWLGSPRKLRRHLRDQTGWEMPALGISWFGCVAVVLSMVLALVVGWQVSGWVIPPVLAGGLMTLRLDRGAWSDDWATLGSLARGIAAHNQAALAASGARRSPATAWHALTTLIADYGIARDSIVKETRLCG